MHSDLADRLNAKKVSPSIDKGKVVALIDMNWVKYPLDSFKITDGYLEEHPEGADRGGYVAYVTDGTDGAYYDSDGVWRSNYSQYKTS